MSFFVSQGFASEASLSAPHDLQKHQKLIRFLQIAQAANVGFMPLTWTKDFEQLGSGTSAAVTQTALSSQTSLAFKRFNLVRSDGTSGAGERLDAQYDDMATELRTLALPGMKSHPNIINLVGVCFEIAPSSDDVLPVLVLERADLTSMAWLMYELPMIASEEDVVLPPSLEVCFEVAKALSMLHQHGIVHCDIKPANVLINRDIIPGHVQVKLGDFAFSRSNLPEESPFKVSRTEPWEAPEWHQRYFTFESAKKMDIYSFGLLCLWSFFKNDTLEEVGEDATVGSAFSGHFPSQTAKLQSLKKDGVAFLKCAARLVEQSRDLDKETRSRLSKLFPLILTSDPERRAPDIDMAVDILRVDPCIPETLEYSQPIVTKVQALDWHGAFQLEDTYYNLETADYRVASSIVRALRDMAGGEGCDACCQNAAFQLAICFFFGFGTADDASEVAKWLGLSCRTATDLAAVLQRMGNDNKRSVIHVDLSQRGFTNDLPDRYRQDGVLPEAIKLHSEMLAARERVFGPSHTSAVRIRKSLADLLIWDDRAGEALRLILEDRARGKWGDLDPLDQLVLKSQLAQAQMDVGALDEAKSTRREVYVACRDGPFSKHPFRIAAQVRLVEVLALTEETEDAVSLATEAEERAKLDLGVIHPIYIEAVGGLAMVYDRMTNLAKAIERYETVEALASLSLPPDHPRFLRDLVSLGVLYYRNGDNEAAMRCYNKVKEAARRNPANATDAIRTAADQATRLASRPGCIEEATKGLERLLSVAQQLLGETDPCLAYVLLALGKLQFDRDDFANAEALLRRYFVIAPLDDPEKPAQRLAFLAASLLAQSIASQERWLESARFDMLAMSALRRAPYSAESDELGIVIRASRSFTYGRAWTDAIPLLDREISWRKSRDGLEGRPTTHLTPLTMQAVCLIKTGDPENVTRATEAVREVVWALQEPFEELPDELLSCLVSLGKRCIDIGNFPEAGQVLAGCLLLVTSLPSVSPLVRRMVGSAIASFLALGRSQDELQWNPAVLS